ncbi:hypothetical protein Acid7E03_05690 [Acidisoma sp. 7E03]
MEVCAGTATLPCEVSETLLRCAHFLDRAKPFKGEAGPMEGYSLRMGHSFQICRHWAEQREIHGSTRLRKRRCQPCRIAPHSAHGICRQKDAWWRPCARQIPASKAARGQG